MKKAFFFVLVIVLALSILTACSSGNENNGGNSGNHQTNEANQTNNGNNSGFETPNIGNDNANNSNPETQNIGSGNGNGGFTWSVDPNWNNPNWQFVHENHPTYVAMANNFTWVTNDNRLYANVVVVDDGLHLISEDAFAVFESVSLEISRTSIDTLYLSSSNELRRSEIRQPVADGPLSFSYSVIAENVADTAGIWRGRIILKRDGTLELLRGETSLTIAESVSKILPLSTNRAIFVTQTGALYHGVFDDNFSSVELIRIADTVINIITNPWLSFDNALDTWVLCSTVNENGETVFFLLSLRDEHRFYVDENYAQFLSTVDAMRITRSRNDAYFIIHFLLTYDGVVLRANNEHLSEAGAFGRRASGVIQEHLYPLNPSGFDPILTNVSNSAFFSPEGRPNLMMPSWYVSMVGNLYDLDTETMEYVRRLEDVHTGGIRMVIFNDGTVQFFDWGGEDIIVATNMRLQ